MIIHDLDGFRSAVNPTKTETKLVVDLDGIFSASVAFERFESITGRHSHGIKPSCGVQLVELSSGHVPYIAGAGSSSSFSIAPVEHIASAWVGERSNHIPILMDNMMRIKELTFPQF
jgi:hypothetical protein